MVAMAVAAAVIYVGLISKITLMMSASRLPDGWCGTIDENRPTRRVDR